jgi:hypothetical protein
LTGRRGVCSRPAFRSPGCRGSRDADRRARLLRVTPNEPGSRRRSI